MNHFANHLRQSPIAYDIHECMATLLFYLQFIYICSATITRYLSLVQVLINNCPL
ncbi:MAG: hypothetical protein ACJASL_002885 [Paraglaciecola sp.]|jgi:hypothetical protein